VRSDTAVRELGRREARALGVAGLLAGLGAAAALVGGGYPVPVDVLAPALVLNLSVGWSFIGVGINAWTRRPDSRTGLFMVVLGFAWLARIVGAVDAPAAYVVGITVNSLYLGVFAHLLVGSRAGGCRAARSGCSSGWSTCSRCRSTSCSC
jgi:hypothetical protein